MGNESVNEATNQTRTPQIHGINPPMKKQTEVGCRKWGMNLPMKQYTKLGRCKWGMNLPMIQPTELGRHKRE